MKQQVLFVQGGSNGGYEADALLVASLQSALGAEYHIRYPLLAVDDTAADFGWPSQIGTELAHLHGAMSIVAHSLGASLLLKYLSENSILHPIRGIFLIASPFWEGNEEWVQGLKLGADFANQLPKEVPFYFYHCRDDQEVPFTHFLRYKEKLPWATFCPVTKGGHQLGNNLSRIAKDIKDVKGTMQ